VTINAVRGYETGKKGGVAEEEPCFVHVGGDGTKKKKPEKEQVLWDIKLRRPDKKGPQGKTKE